MKSFRLLFFTAATIFALSAAAANQSLELQPVRDQQAEIRAGALAKTGPYAKLNENQRTELFQKQNRLLAIIGDKRNASELKESDRTEVFNILEWIEGTVNNTGNDRMVCERTRKTGTNRMVRTCRTERQWRESRERARRQMEGNMPIDI